MDPNKVTVGWAWLAGLASFLSPCVLALLPAYVGYLGGRSTGDASSGERRRWGTFAHGLAFVVGFSFVFIALGVTASALGALLYDMRVWIARLGGVVVIFFGLHTMGVINIPILNVDLRRQKQPDPRLGYLSSALMGVFFSAGWAPCVGPVLGAVLTLAMSTAKTSQGVVLLSAYSLGLAIPFLLAALGIGGLTEWLRRHGRVIKVVSIVMGAIMVVLGILLHIGALGRLAAFGFFIDFGI